MVYGVTAAASAYTPVEHTVQPEVAIPSREVRLVVVSHEVEKSVSEEEVRAVGELVDSVSEKESNPLLENIIPADRSEEEEESGHAREVPVNTDIPDVPFYSQFTDITSAEWQKVGCGIASLAMVIDYYSDDVESVDTLLKRGINAGAYLNDAGWIHDGLIGLLSPYQLKGESVSLVNVSSAAALTELKRVLESGPVIASVHYTFEPTNPIPHLVVVLGIRDGLVYYNDPAEAIGGGSVSVQKFQSAWKQRYISIRPV